MKVMKKTIYLFILLFAIFAEISGNEQQSNQGAITINFVDKKTGTVFATRQFPKRYILLSETLKNLIADVGEINQPITFDYSFIRGFDLLIAQLEKLSPNTNPTDPYAQELMRWDEYLTPEWESRIDSQELEKLPFKDLGALANIADFLDIDAILYPALSACRSQLLTNPSLKQQFFASPQPNFNPFGLNEMLIREIINPNTLRLLHLEMEPMIDPVQYFLYRSSYADTVISNDAPIKSLTVSKQGDVVALVASPEKSNPVIKIFTLVDKAWILQKTLELQPREHDVSIGLNANGTVLIVQNNQNITVWQHKGNDWLKTQTVPALTADAPVFIWDNNDLLLITNNQMRVMNQNEQGEYVERQNIQTNINDPVASLSHNNRMLAVGSKTKNNISVFEFDQATGQWSPNKTIITNFPNLALAISNDNKILFATPGGNDTVMFNMEKNDWGPYVSYGQPCDGSQITKLLTSPNSLSFILQGKKCLSIGRIHEPFHDDLSNSMVTIADVRSKIKEIESPVIINNGVIFGIYGHEVITLPAPSFDIIDQLKDLNLAQTLLLLYLFEQRKSFAETINISSYPQTIHALYQSIDEQKRKALKPLIHTSSDPQPKYLFPFPLKYKNGGTSIEGNDRLGPILNPNLQQRTSLEGLD